jgi:hypothetical protein
MGRLALVLLLTTVAAASELGAQTARNAVYFELSGSAIVPSFNYERRLGERWHGRAGISGIDVETSHGTDTALIVPLTISSVNRPHANHHLEMGGGVTFVDRHRQGLGDSDIAQSVRSAGVSLATSIRSATASIMASVI